MNFAVDDRFKGVTAQQDKVVDALHKDGHTLYQAFTAPDAVLPLPSGRYPKGRVYLFVGDIAVVVKQDNGSVIASLPVKAALETLAEYTPDVIEANSWASARWEELQNDGGDDGPGAFRKHHQQSFYDASGARWTVKRTVDGAAGVSRDGAPLHVLRSGDEAEDLGLDPVIAELVEFVTRTP